jgi:hypothetical protein
MESNSKVAWVAMYKGEVVSLYVQSFLLGIYKGGMSFHVNGAVDTVLYGSEYACMG